MPYHYSSWDRVTPQNLAYWRRIFTQRLHSARRTEPPNPARILAWELAVARVDVLLAAENPAPMDGRQAIALLERAQTLAGFTPYAERAARRAAGLKSHDAPKGTVIDENSGTYVPELRRCFRCKGEHPRDAFLVFPTPAQRALYRIEPDSPRKVPHKLCPACRAHLHTIETAVRDWPLLLRPARSLAFLLENHMATQSNQLYGITSFVLEKLRKIFKNSSR